MELVALWIGVAASALALAGGAWGLGRWAWRRLQGRQFQLRGIGKSSRKYSVGIVDPAEDASEFVSNTLTDGACIEPGGRFQNTWVLRNAGKVAWQDRYLQRVGANSGPGLITSPRRVPIRRTEPGNTAAITVKMIAPTTEGTTTARFKMADSTGSFCFPYRYPAGVFVTINVVKRAGQ